MKDSSYDFDIVVAVVVAFVVVVEYIVGLGVHYF